MRKYCETCGMIHDVIIKEEERTYKVKDIEITENLYITYCNVCQNEVYNKEMELKNDIIMFNAYKKAKNLLTSEEIKKLRAKYDISQEALSRLLGFGLKTITRYENGSIQDETHDTILRLINNEEVFKILFKIKKDNLNLNEQEKIERKLDEMIPELFKVRFRSSEKIKYELRENPYGLDFDKFTYEGREQNVWH